jgi:hypothetical protein
VLLGVLMLHKVVCYVVGILRFNTIRRYGITVAVGGGRGRPFTRLRVGVEAD